MKYFVLAFALLTVCFSASPASAALADEQQLVAANTTFAFNLLKQLNADQPARNIFISPYSASTVLQMVDTGAVGRTKVEMDQALGVTSLTPDALGAASQGISQMLTGGPNVTLTTANAIWYRKDFKVKHDFLARGRKLFGSTVDALDFADPHSVDVINNWADTQTHGKITHFADGMIDPRATELFLANAVYFKGKWAEPFKPEATYDHPFHLRGGTDKTVRLMTQSKVFVYRSGPGYQAVRLPYVGNNLAMVVFLPDTNSSPERLLDIMSGDLWQNDTRGSFKREQGTLELPKFKLEDTLELAKPLAAMGMKSAFDPAVADFSGMAPELHISAVRQKTFVEVKEEGTEAAAVTGVAMAGAALAMPPPEHFEMIVDRPFLFLIEDNRTGTILFMGVVYEPKAD